MFFTCFSFAQNEQNEPILRSGSRIIMEEALKDPEKRQILEQLEIFTAEFIANMDNNRMSGPYIIPLVVHVIHNYGDENISYEQVDNALTRLNEDFQGLNDDLSEVVDSFTNIVGNPNFEFRLATKDPDGNCTYGVNRVASPWSENSSSTKVMSIANWDDRKYINIYIVRSFEESMSSAAAYAVKPGSGSSEYGDYIFFRYDYFGDWNVNNDSGPTGSQYNRHVPTHEMGHFMNLDHPWGGNNDAAQEDNCAIDDGVEDTPETIGTIGPCTDEILAQATCDGSLDNVQNFMEYSYCICMFTQGQAERMLAAANSLAGNRWYLWQEDNLIATGTDDESMNNNPYAECAPIPDFKAERSLGCAGTQVTFENFTYNYRNAAVSYEWAFEVDDSDTPLMSTVVNPTVTYDNPGSYDVTLTACRDGNCNTVTRENAITIISDMDITPSETSLQNFEVDVFDSDNETLDEVWWGGDDHGEQHWKRTEETSYEGTWALKIKSQNYGYDRQAHAFATPELNLSDFSNNADGPLTICFDIAYAKRLPYNAVDFDDNGIVDGDPFSIHNDALIISYKTSCEADWFDRARVSTREQGSEQFQESLFTTDKLYFNSFIPQEDEWGQRCINIQTLAGIEEAVIKFEFQGTGQDQYDLHWVDDGFSNQGELITASNIGGNWLYLDNILIGPEDLVKRNDESTTSRNDIMDNLVVSPNPSYNNDVSLSFELLDNSLITISISNFLGLDIGRKQMTLSSGSHKLKLSELFNLSKGSYIISIESDSDRLSDIIIIR